MTRIAVPDRSDTADRTVGLFPLWFGLLAGPAAWTAHLLVGYLLVTLACIADLKAARALLYALTAAMAMLALAGLVVALRSWRQAGVDPGGDLGESGGWQGFMAVSGVLLSGLSAIAILVESMAIPILEPCE